MKLTPFFTNIWSFYLNLDFVKLEEISFEVEKEHQSMMFSNVGGYQSPQLEMKEKFPELFQKLKDCFFDIGSELNTNFKIGKSWLNINRKHEYNISHVHPRVTLSGVFYIKTPKNCGNIVFENPANLDICIASSNLNGFGEKCIFPAEQGRLLIFPSYLKHYVEQNLSDEPRISLAFNLTQED